ncbi:hypothetical protein METBIDRAFT_31894 [Metschnikowia bicuspidata var. bicuspidata NRRL YB-4993]|uniref:Uncharacterized protein n=1 Tax=Metschnikowia bicuspidata var. bicuspidata NRRL YB-4993 TaxID=869754 RepID=A0A1A0HB46_9ASCO|nr:hypothetical protein METBIDRAFT_31894 [Metschnikowia bicuspidata var. bicuspidata NRRL YB-4993]OBA21349.1 hypothetical protein METBIDRAFT_31894 [Metschnikowia bicuspidata var. bicuspidata NRRL YB-4993]
MNNRNDQKRRKITLTGKARSVPEKTAPIDDQIDPVEKLLSFSHVDNDILLLMDDADHAPAPAPGPASGAAYPNISCNFDKMIHDNMRLYYSKFRKSQMEIHNDHSSFSVLTRPVPEAPKPTVDAAQKPRTQVPFFRNVNFNPTPSFGQHIDDYIHYDADEPLTTDSEHEELEAPRGVVETPIPSLSGKMSFHYRQDDKLNLSLTDGRKAGEDAPHDVFKFLNQRSVLSGKASEMIGTSSFLVSDFFF